MKKLSDLLNLKFEATKLVTEQARHLMLAGLAIVWLFAGPFFVGDSGEKPDSVLFWAGALLATALAVDLAQLIARVIVLQVLVVRRGALRTEAVDDPEVDDYGPLNWITALFFYGKLIVLSAGYVFILIYFVRAAT